ncbi:DUF2538 family protein [Calidifontibacillus erzurumensis]|uniref:DUF2538 family protein n=1 Tax=Calidifontibacillus erzurumensis TaxID=2741433 RepID=UPI0035B5432B
MEKIYFVNEQHELNLKRILLKWNVAKNNPEYAAACYIMAVPMIFEKIEPYIGFSETPVDWILRWEWKHTLSKLPEHQDDEDQEELERIPYDLTGSMVQLGKLALNLWNGYEHFNLMNCLSRLDEDNYNVLKCAIDIRMGIHKLSK